MRILIKGREYLSRVIVGLALPLFLAQLCENRYTDKHFFLPLRLEYCFFFPVFLFFSFFFFPEDWFILKMCACVNQTHYYYMDFFTRKGWWKEIDNSILMVNHHSTWKVTHCSTHLWLVLLVSHISSNLFCNHCSVKSSQVKNLSYC